MPSGRSDGGGGVLGFYRKLRGMLVYGVWQPHMFGSLHLRRMSPADDTGVNIIRPSPRFLPPRGIDDRWAIGARNPRPFSRDFPAGGGASRVSASRAAKTWLPWEVRSCRG